MSSHRMIVGIFSFASEAAYITACREVLYRDATDTEIIGEDRRLIEAIFNARLDKVVELRGRAVVRFLRKIHRFNTPCFFVELDDGALLDFSFMKLVRRSHAA